MTEWVWTAAGADVGEAEAVSAWSLRWNLETWGVVAAVLLALLAVLTWWLYRKSPQDVKPGRRWFLTAVRVAFFALLLAILLQPMLVLTLEREVSRTLPVLVDATGSMEFADADGVSRLGMVRESFTEGIGREALTILGNDLDVAVLSFDANDVRDIDGDWRALQSGGESTALGDMLAKTLERYRGAALAGVVVVSDGGHNDGRPLAEAARLLEEAGVPVFAVGVGDEDARDVAVEGVEVREVLLADDAAPVSVRLRAQGMGGERGRVVVSLGGVDVAEEVVVFEGDGPIEVRTLFVPKRAGEYPLEVRFESDGLEEALAQNNTGRAALRVVDRRLRVLLVDQAPRWEYKYLEAMLLRERRVDLSCHLFEADAELARIPGSPHLERFPLRPEELFEYDLVILGDIDPRFLTDAHQELLGDYVSQAGGALVVVAGKRSLPGDYARSELARLLPVALAGGSLGTPELSSTRPVRLELTAAGRASVMLQLGDDPEVSAALWQRLPPVFWTARVERAKPAAEVLVTRRDPSGEGEALPVVALHRYGAGEVLFVGTDNFWRWRRNVGDRYHATLWGQIIQRMAGARLLTEVPRMRLQADQRRYRRGERVRIYARLFAENWEPRSDEMVPAALVSSGDPDRRREVSLRAVPGQPGMYRAEMAAGEPGNYRLALAGEEVATLDFTVRDDNRELARAALDAPLLRELAAQTGGAYFPFRDLDKLPAAVTNRTARLATPLEVALWSSPLVFGLLILLITIEWVVRKFCELK